MKILIVEDSERLRRALGHGFERLGYEVEAVGDGEEGLRRARTGTPDLLVLDLMLPGRHGLEIVRELRAEGHRVPILVLSAQDTVDDRIEGLRAGADDYLVKPFDFGEVCARLEAISRRAADRRGEGEGLAVRARRGGLEGELLDGRYRLQEEIGRGGFAVVYRGRHIGLRRPVAVKVLHVEDPETEEGFEREGVTACRVRHRNAVSVLDSGRTEEGVRYLVMELLEGETLAAAVEREGRLPLSRVRTIVPPICEVLATAHRAGIVHRDVKPENVFLHRDERGETVKVLDFGISKWLWVDDDVSVTLRETGNLLVGTLPYLSPEQVRSEPVDPRSDVYSLSVLIHRLLAGELPFPRRRDFLGLLTAIAEEPAPSLASADPELPRDVVDVVARGLAKDPEARPRLEEISLVLRPLLSDPIPVPRVAPREARP